MFHTLLGSRYVCTISILGPFWRAGKQTTALPCACEIVATRSWTRARVEPSASPIDLDVAAVDDDDDDDDEEEDDDDEYHSYYVDDDESAYVFICIFA